jgi:hypothetical protein
MSRHFFLPLLAFVCAACAGAPATPPRPVTYGVPGHLGGATLARIPAPSADSAATCVPVAAVIDTVRVRGRLSEPGAMRDPRAEPLFIRYASPAEAMGLLRAYPFLDPDRIRWRYSPADSDSAKGR